MSWLKGFEDANRAQVLGLRPDVAQRVDELETALRRDGRLDPAIVDLVQVRVGQILGLSGSRLDTTAELSPRQQAAVGFAEQYVLDPSGVTDEQAAQLNELFTEPELTALTFCVAVYDAVGRADLVLGITEPGRLS